MPKIYLSPSTQEFNIYVNDTQSEEYYMNLIADAMVPYMEASGIEYVRNTKNMTAASSIAQSNEGNYDLHLALHSNAGAGEFAGKAQGVEIYYYPTSTRGRRFADILAEKLKQIYPNPALVRTVATTALGEVSRTRAPGVLVEYAFHDNIRDADWIRDNIDIIARYTVMALCEYFGIPFNLPGPVRYGIVRTESGGGVNIRGGPSTSARVIGSAPTGASVAVYAARGDWYAVKYGSTEGYMNKNYVVIT